MATKTVIQEMTKHGLRALEDRVERLEELCEKLIEEDHKLRERLTLLQLAMGPAKDQMDIETNGAAMENHEEEVTGEEAAIKKENGV